MRLRYVVVVALLGLVTGCGSDGGGGLPGGGGGGLPGGGGGGGGAPDPCTFLPDAAIETALGAPIGERTPYAAGESCSFESNADPSVIIQVTVAGGGRDGFEVHRGYVKDIEDMYGPVSGLGEDAFHFGPEVTVLQGSTSVTIFVEGTYWFDFDDAQAQTQRFERAKALAQAAVDVLS